MLQPELNTIWKYDIPVIDDFTLELPAGSIPLSVGAQRGQPVMWVAVNSSSEEKEQHQFYLRGTGHPFPGLLLHRFVGTLQMGFCGDAELVFHLFDGGPV